MDGVKIKVQSKYLVDEGLLVNIWRRSSLGPFNDWQRQPRTNLGVFSSDFTFFWGNWINTNKGLIPVFYSSCNPLTFRLIVTSSNLKKSYAIKESLVSFYIYKFNSDELTKLQLVVNSRPQLLESQAIIDKIPEWVLKKIWTLKNEKPSDVTQGRIDALAARWQGLKQRRAYGEIK